MVGFVYGMTGVESGRLVHWSDILAVSPEVRNDGVGRRLKAFQREAVLPLGVTRMYWTFDPLESRNAYLNLGRLGAVAREYAPDMYGVSDSPLHRGLGTDRFVATWELDSPRVEARLAGEPGPTLDQVAHLPEAFPVVGGGDSGELPRPDPPAADVLDRGQEAGGLRVPIPLQIQELRDRNPELAAQWRGATRAVLHSATQCGWEVRELVRAPNLSYYVVVPD
jgi:predicted GNAT superfamily acetyltransferase